MRALIASSVFLLLNYAAFGQTFEVASVKPSPASDATAAAPPVTSVDSSGVRLRLPLQKVICMAYQVRVDQVAGPAWLASTSFDIQAKLPKGATVDQIPTMLQNLLTDRFQMTARREDREQSVYALVVNKAGLRMKAKPTDASAPPPPSCAANIFESPRGGDGSVSAGDRKTVMGPNGMRAEMSRIATLVNLATAFTDRPVIDKTGLKGGYEISLDIPLTVGRPSDPVGTIDPVIVNALDKLGLKLVSQKLPVETIVVEHIERTPTDN